MKSLWRMPVEFGPMQQPESIVWGETLSIGASFVTDRNALARVLPKGFRPADPPLVSVYQNTYKAVNFLGGRGYNYAGVAFWCEYSGTKGTISGMFLPCCWMNDTLAIVGGRESLGFPKMYADVPDPMRKDNGWRCYWTEYGHKLADIVVEDLVAATPDQLDAVRESMSKQVWFLHKYITDPDGNPEVDYLTYATADVRVDSAHFGKGYAEFYEHSWEDVPGSYTVIAGLKSLPVLKWVGATVWTGRIEVGQSGKLS